MIGGDDAGVVTVLGVDFVVEPSVGGVGVIVGGGVGVGAGISFRMRSRWLMYHALTLSSIVAGSVLMRNARSVFLFLAATLVLRSLIFTFYFSIICAHHASHFSSLWTA